MHTKKRKKGNNDTDDSTDLPTCSKKMKQTTLTKNLVPKAVNFDKLIVNFVVDTMTPLSIVDNDSFKALIEGAQQLSMIPKIMSRRTLGNKILEEFKQSKQNTTAALKMAEFVCTTADIWSSSRKSYLGVTVHWIDCNNNLKRKSATLACRRFKGSHTYDKIAELISDIHSEYDLKLSKIVKTVTDNASNMVKAFKDFGKREQHFDSSDDDNDNNNDEDDLVPSALPKPTDNHEEFLLPNHERCATHTLHLIAAKDIEQARTQNYPYKKLHDAAFAKCQAVWNLCSRSPKACEIYLESTGRSLTSPCPTRWNSYYNCIRDLLTVQEHLNETLRKLNLPSFKDNEIEYLSEYISCLKPIANAIRSLEGDQDIYYGCLLPELMRIRRMLNSLKSDKPKYCSSLIDTIEKSVNKRFNCHLDLDAPSAKSAILAAVSHPFFKLKWVPKHKRENVKKIFTDEVRKIKNKEQKREAENASEKQHEQNESYYLFEESSDSSITNDGNSNTSDLELLHYLTDSDNNLNCLHKYPSIKKVFIHHNTCIPSSAPVERLFSFGGMIMRPHRRKISDELFEKIVILKSTK